MKAAALFVILLLVAACGAGSRPPVIEVQEITCPSEPPPEIPPLPPRPGDLRGLEPDRYRIEGIWDGIQTRQAAYRQAWVNCQ